MKTTIICVCMMQIIISCSSNPSKNNDSTASVSKKGKNVCIKEYQTQLDQLLPLENISKHFEIPQEAKKNYDFKPDSKNHDQDNYFYSWDSDRVKNMKISGMNISVTISNQIGLAWVGNEMFKITNKNTPLESFRFFYQNMTAEEKNDAFKKAGEVLKERGYDNKTTEIATQIGKDLSSDDIMFINVDGVGDAAVWRVKEKNLVVLVDDTTFQVMVDVSNDQNVNIELAKKLAIEVLNKCE